MITQKTTKHGTEFFIDGERFTILTRETTSEQLVKFNRACHTVEKDLAITVHNAKAKRDWNFANPGKGRDWPEFRTMERAVNKLLAEAGIKDS